MKNLFQSTWKLAPVLLLLLAGSVMTVQAQGPKLQMDQLDLLANRASQTVDVKLDERLLQTTWKFISGKDPGDAKIKEVLKGLKGIYVKSFSFDKEGEYSQIEVDSVMSQLSSWSKVLTVKSKKDGQNIGVYLSMIGDQINGLAVLSLEPKELTVVNIVGPIDLEKLSELEGQFGVPDLGIEQEKTKKP